MTIAPLFKSTCDFAMRMPSLVSDFLELENKIGRRFREDSVTDIIIASLLRIEEGNATVLVPPEVKTGGDFDILIIEPSTNDAIQYRIQAKRLHPHLQNWKWSSYRELDHPHGSGQQSSTLVRSSSQEAIETIPLYAFYNPRSICVASDDAIAGIEMASGRQINEIVKAIVKARRKGRRLRWKRVHYIRELFFPLADIFCAPSGVQQTSSIASPRVSKQAVESAIEKRGFSERVKKGIIIDSMERRKQIFPSTDRVEFEKYVAQSAKRKWPQIVEKVIERKDLEPIVYTKTVKRPKLILVRRDE